MKRIIYVVPGAYEDWLNAIRIMLEKLGVTYAAEDAKKLCNTPNGDQIVVTYNDAEVDAILDNMDKCDYLNSTSLDENSAYKLMQSRACHFDSDIDEWIDEIYESIPELLIDKDLSKAANALVYYPTWVKLHS